MAGIDFEQAARDYLERLTLEHFAEATSQATQRGIFLYSFAIARARRKDIQTFNELLVQWARPRRRRPGQVVPDNMVVVWPESIKAGLSYDLPKQPTGPFWVLDYVSRSNKRKDYEDNFDKYEQELKVPYCLLFYPDEQELTLYRHTGKKYAAVRPNEHGRLAVPELEMEVALQGGWARFWFRGELLLLAAEQLAELDQARRRVADARKRTENLEREVQRLRAQLGQKPRKRKNSA